MISESASTCPKCGVDKPVRPVGGWQEPLSAKEQARATAQAKRAERAAALEDLKVNDPAAYKRHMRTVGVVFGAVVLLIVGIAVFGGGNDDSSPTTGDSSTSADDHISRADLGSDWPLTTDEGTLACEGSGGVGSATITTGGTKYALNGIAIGRKDGADIRPVWADDESLGLGIKKSIAPLIDAALKLCK